METVGVTEIDNFLPSELFDQVIREFNDKASHQGSQPFLSVLRGPWFFHGHKENVLNMDLPSSVQAALGGFLTGSPMDLPSSVHAPSSATAEITGQLNWGEHRDHHDVTCTGAEVSGEVCLLYLGGSGTLVLTDQTKEAEYRIQIRPNVAVKWPNADFTHRVEALAGDGPRMMLGPYTVDGLGGLTRTLDIRPGDGYAEALFVILALMFFFVVMVPCGMIFGFGNVWKVCVVCLVCYLLWLLRPVPRRPGGALIRH